MPIQSDSRRYTFPAMIDKAGVHYGLYLLDMNAGTVHSIDDEVYSAVHVNGVLIKGVSEAGVAKLTGCMTTEDMSAPRKMLERIWTVLKGQYIDESVYCALDFRGQLLEFAFI